MPEVDPAKEHPSTRLRLPSPDEIVYHLVGNREKLGVEVPMLLQSPTLQLLQEFPKSGYQVFGPLRFQQLHAEHNVSQPFRFGVVFSDKFPQWAGHILSAPAMLHVFLWHTIDVAAIDALRSVKVPHLVLCPHPEIEAALRKRGINQKRFPATPAELWAEIEASAKELSRLSAAQFAELKKSARENAEEFHRNVYPRAALPFAPLKVNVAQLRQLFGEFLVEWEELPNNFQLRAPQLAESFGAVAAAAHLIRTGEPNEEKRRPAFPHAILAFPSINPRLKEVFKPATKEPISDKARALLRDYSSGRLSEQNSITYENMIELRDEGELNEAQKLGAEKLAAYNRFFDLVGYLHASFDAAPYLRAPVQGGSLTQQHSFFSPRNFNENSNDHAVRKKVFQFGEAISGSLHFELREVLKDYPGGVVAMSDLPIEWMMIDGTPLCFLKDVCRMPEGIVTNLLSQFSRNAASCFEITPETPARTLVVCGAAENDSIAKGFEGLRELGRDNSSEGPWRMEYCRSLDRLYGLVKEFRPEFLIIDSHGRYRDDKIGTEIQFGSQHLNGNDVIKHFPQIPLVFMSACWGAPLYGSTNAIAHAFFETGSFAVTSAQLPLDVVRGTVLYARILGNLKNAAERAIHPTWSSFLSHTIRTSYQLDLMAQVAAHFSIGRDGMPEANRKRQVDWYLKTQNAATRAEAFRESYEVASDAFSAEHKAKVKTFLESKAYLPEFMFYSTMGRADLVHFAEWNKARFKPGGATVSIRDLIGQSGENGSVKPQHDVSESARSSIAPT